CPIRSTTFEAASLARFERTFILRLNDRQAPLPRDEAERLHALVKQAEHTLDLPDTDSRLVRLQWEIERFRFRSMSPVTVEPAPSVHGAASCAPQAAVQLALPDAPQLASATSLSSADGVSFESPGASVELPGADEDDKRLEAEAARLTALARSGLPESTLAVLGAALARACGSLTGAARHAAVIAVCRKWLDDLERACGVAV